MDFKSLKTAAVKKSSSKLTTKGKSYFKIENRTRTLIIPENTTIDDALELYSEKYPNIRKEMYTYKRGAKKGVTKQVLRYDVETFVISKDRFDNLELSEYGFIVIDDDNVTDRGVLLIKAPKSESLVTFFRGSESNAAYHEHLLELVEKKDINKKDIDIKPLAKTTFDLPEVYEEFKDNCYFLTDSDITDIDENGSVNEYFKDENYEGEFSKPEMIDDTMPIDSIR